MSRGIPTYENVYRPEKVDSGERNSITAKLLQENFFYTGLAFLSPPVRRHCNNTKRTDTIQLNITLNTNLSKQNKEAVGSTRRLLQYCQLPDKKHTIFRGIFGIFRGISKFLFIYSTISRGTPDDVLRNPGWETLL
jgi:hypothetical protein